MAGNCRRITGGDYQSFCHYRQWLLGQGDCENFRYHLEMGLRFYPPGTTGFVDVRDVARMSIQLMESDFHSIRVIANADNWNYHKFFSKIAEALGKKPPTIAANAFMSALAWRADWLRAKLTGGHHVITKSRVHTTQCSHSFNNNRSTELLDFTYTELWKRRLKKLENSLSACQQNGKAVDFLMI